MESLINCFKVKELRNKIFVTMALIAVYRLGTFLTIPGVDIVALQTYVENLSQGELGKLVNMVNMFSGGGLSKATLFALGIMPYISASIIFQMMSSAVPALEKISKEGPSGRRKISQWTRYATMVICLFQAVFIAQWLQSNPLGPNNPIVADVNQGPWFTFLTVVTLTAGTAFLLWLGEQLTAHGIGNGISLIIMASIISAAPVAVTNIVENFAFDGSKDLAIGGLIVLLALFAIVTFLVVAITRGQRRVPVQQAKMTKGQGNTTGAKTYLPLKVNHAGVIPIIFAQAILIIPQFLITKFFPAQEGLFAYNSFLYNFVYVSLIIFFCFFYTAIIFNPKDMSENMKQNGSFIPGIRPGSATANFLEFIMIRITFAGAIFFAFIAIFPLIMMQGFTLSYAVTGFFGGTGLLIMVGVGLDIVDKVEASLLTSNYDGFMGSTRIKGRI